MSRRASMGRKLGRDAGGRRQLRGTRVRAARVGSQRAPPHHRCFGGHGEEDPRGQGGRREKR